MVRCDFLIQRDDGVELYRTYSDNAMMIRKDGTDEIYSEAIDVDNSGYTYTETDIPIDDRGGDLTVEDTLEMLGELGVDVDD